MAQSASGKPPTRRQLAAEETRRKLLAAALEAFADRPYADVTVGEIARSAGVAQGLLSHHFKGKDGLYAEAVREVDAQLRAARSVSKGGPLSPLLQQRFRSHVEFLARNRKIAVHLILRRAGATEVAWAAFDSTRLHGIQEICHLLDLDPELPALLPALRAFAAAADELILIWLQDTDTFPVETLAAALVDLLSGALAAAARLAPDKRLNAVIAELRKYQAGQTGTTQEPPASQ
ncbi:TetR/AcrR family transcriptional regulator [Streptomyces sp. SS1-1]|uniref:TetR/AcrR family transcriptional regulator n=1 Tax=Streptomyces sp. SS1-1 TaxID=2651869 RepID=UPI00178C46DC|nr:TetR/AcrR family transcriptional regulator [Streptomyces sp. SS1-1]